MSVFVVAQLSITDRAVYDRYQGKFLEVFRKFSGELLAADENPRIIEAGRPAEKVILIKFPDENAFEEWATSPAYQEIAKDRRAGSEGVVLLVKGLK